jgi:hypothetical protein
VYIPIFFGLLCCEKPKKIFFFNASNPIKNGGFIMESKKAIYNLIHNNITQSGTYKEKVTSVSGN